MKRISPEWAPNEPYGWEGSQMKMCLWRFVSGARMSNCNTFASDERVSRASGSWGEIREFEKGEKRWTRFVKLTLATMMKARPQENAFWCNLVLLCNWFTKTWSYIPSCCLVKNLLDSIYKPKGNSSFVEFLLRDSINDKNHQLWAGSFRVVGSFQTMWG